MKPDWRLTMWLTVMIMVTVVWLLVAVTVAVSAIEPEIGTALYCEQVNGVIECEERP